MINEEREKHLNELMPKRKIVNIHNKIVHFRPLIFLVLGLLILVSVLSEM